MCCSYIPQLVSLTVPQSRESNSNDQYVYWDVRGRIIDVVSAEMTPPYHCQTVLHKRAFIQ